MGSALRNLLHSLCGNKKLNNCNHPEMSSEKKLFFLLLYTNVSDTQQKKKEGKHVMSIWTSPFNLTRSQKLKPPVPRELWAWCPSSGKTRKNRDSMFIFITGFPFTFFWILHLEQRKQQSSTTEAYLCYHSKLSFGRGFCWGRRGVVITGCNKC